MERVRKIIPWIGMLVLAGLLGAHLLQWNRLDVDTTSLVLLGGLLLLPFLEYVRKIRIGDFEAEIAPREVAEALSSAELELAPLEAEEPPRGKREPQILQLVRHDPRLGLAKLRLEIEQALRSLDRINRSHERRGRPVALSRLVGELENSGRLPSELAAAIRDVLPLANRAVHGERVRREDAEDLALLGTRILEGLRWTYSNQVGTTLESEPIERTEMESLMSAQFRVETVVPLADSPRREVRILDQVALSEFLEGYNEYAEFLVAMKPLDEGKQRSST